MLRMLDRYRDELGVTTPANDYQSEVTTSLLSGATYAKDNRLLPRGFDKATAESSVAVRGGAFADGDFRGGGDDIRYRVSLPEGIGSVEVSAQLLYQTIGYRWAKNLAGYDAHETDRFLGYYRENAAESAVVLAEATVRSSADGTGR